MDPPGALFRSTSATFFFHFFMMTLCQADTTRNPRHLYLVRIHLHLDSTFIPHFSLCYLMAEPSTSTLEPFPCVDPASMEASIESLRGKIAHSVLHALFDAVASQLSTTASITWDDQTYWITPWGGISAFKTELVPVRHPSHYEPVRPASVVNDAFVKLLNDLVAPHWVVTKSWSNKLTIAPAVTQE
jgi:hypothetical protein